MITRISVLPDERKLLLGIDKANIFTPGIVYDISKILDEIVIRPIGKYALPAKGDIPCELSAAEDIIYYGFHLITIEEYKKMIEEQKSGK